MVPTEKVVQAHVRGLYKQLGGIVFDLSQGYRPGGRRHGTTRQTKGLADLFVFFPDRNFAFWHEVKKPGGEQSDEQRRFQELCGRCGIGYVLGGVDEAIAALNTLGFKLVGGVSRELAAESQAELDVEDAADQAEDRQLTQEDGR